MPREYLDDPQDRYILEEEGDVTEITFLTKGDWAVCFNSYTPKDATSDVDLEEDDFDTKTPKDMC
jgi:hypothetical protein